MTVTVSLALLAAIGVAALLRFRAVGIGAAALCALLGFSLADTINATVGAITDAVSGIGR